MRAPCLHASAKIDTSTRAGEILREAMQAGVQQTQPRATPHWVDIGARLQVLRTACETIEAQMK